MSLAVPQVSLKKQQKYSEDAHSGPVGAEIRMGARKVLGTKTTIAIEALLDGEAKAIARKAIEKALEGDMAALRLCFERLLPPRRDRPAVSD
jgi:hypothetical protein